MRLTLRTLLAYLDDTLPGEEASLIGQKVAESPAAQELVDKIKQVTRRRRLSTPPADKGSGSDANSVAEYLSDALPSEKLEGFETMCLESDVHLAEVAACHQILTLLLSEPVRVPPTARQRMYRLVTGPESLPNRKPGSTVPVGGVLPDEPLPQADDSDAAYLLGLKAFGQTDSRGQRVTQLLVLGGLVAGLGLTALAAWPKSQPADLPPKPTAVAVKPPEEKEKPKPPEHPEPPAVPMDPPKELPKDDAVPPPPPPPPMNPKPPVDIVPAAQPPKPDAMPVGQLDTPAAVVLADRGGKWVRVMPAMPGVTTAEKLVALPGSKATVKLDTGPVVELWGNVPDQVPIPILESAVTFHPPYDGFAADLTLHAGRIYLTTTKPNTAVRVRSGPEAWDVTLPDATADVVVEVTHRLPAGLTVDVDPSEKPLATMQLAVLKGTAKLKVRYKPLPDLIANDTVYWSSKGVGFEGPRKLVANPMLLAGSALARTPPLPSEPLAKAAGQTLADLADSFRDPASVRVRLAEMLADAAPGFEETRTDLTKRAVRPCTAVLAAAALGDVPTLADALTDEARPRVRDAAVFGLLGRAAVEPAALDELSKLLVDKSRLTADQAKAIVRLLHGPTEAERTDPKALDGLVEALNSPLLAVRHLAFWVLMNEVDAEARTMKALSGFDAAAPPLARDPVVAAWKRRVEDLKKK